MNKIQTWNLLAKKAQTRANDALSVVAAARNRVDALDKSVCRLNDLHLEYVGRLQTVEEQSHSMRENMNCRSYIAHLGDLKQKLVQTQAKVQEELLRAHCQHQELELVRVKFERLAESAGKAEFRKKALLEQVQMERLAIARFNLG